MVAADQRRHLVLRDQALGFRAAFLRVALVIGPHDLDLLAAETRQAGVFGQRQIEILFFVDDGERRVDGVARIDPGLRRRARHREDGADDDFVCGLRLRGPQICGKRGGACDQFTTIKFHALAPCRCRAIDRRRGQITAYCLFFRSVTSMLPGACVIAKGGFEAASAACGVTPHAQNTGSSSSRTVTASP